MNEFGGPRRMQVEALGGEEEVRRLMRDAGPRPAAPAGDLAAIRAAAREEWRAMATAQTSRRGPWGRRALALAASLLVAALAAWWWGLRPGVGGEAPTVVASVEALAGEIEIAGPRAWLRQVGSGLAVGEPVAAGARLATGEVAAARLALRLDGGHSLRLDRGTSVRLASARRLELERGAVYVDSGSAGEGAIEVMTPLGLVRDVGTRFEVRLVAAAGSGLAVRVRDGRVAWRGEAGAVELAAGEQLTVAPDGEVVRGAVAPWDPLWSWAAAAAPAFEIEGRSLVDYLAWVERETGLTVAWASDDLAVAMRAVVLHGDIVGMTPTESLEAVLPGSSVGYRVEAGVLEIDRP